MRISEYLYPPLALSRVLSGLGAAIDSRPESRHLGAGGKVSVRARLSLSKQPTLPVSSSSWTQTHPYLFHYDARVLDSLHCDPRVRGPVRVRHSNAPPTTKLQTYQYPYLHLTVRTKSAESWLRISWV